jgi:hypothetical protein
MTCAGWTTRSTIGLQGICHRRRDVTRRSRRSAEPCQPAPQLPHSHPVVTAASAVPNLHAAATG